MERTPESKSPGQIVVTSNELVEAKYNFTLWQKRVFVYLVSQIDRRDKEFKLQRIYIKDLLNFFNVKSKDDYNAIRRVPEHLFNARIQTPYYTEEGYKRWRKTRILSAYTEPGDIQPGNAYIELKFNDDLRPHLLELNTLFTKYEIKNIIDLRSVYSFRFYEILKSRRYNTAFLTLGLEELKEMLDVETLYPKYANFKQKVIQMAQRELEEHCDIGFTFKEIKNGRGGKVEKIEFVIHNTGKDFSGAGESKKAKNPGIETIEHEELKPDSEAINQLFDTYFAKIREFGISATTLMDWLKKHSTDHVQACIKDFLQRAADGKIKENDKSKQGGYLRTLIEKADFTAKAEVEKRKKESRQKTETQQVVEQQKISETINLKKAKAEAEAKRARQILNENAGLLEDLISDINLERDREYAVAEFHENGLLRAFVLTKVKERFSEMFET